MIGTKFAIGRNHINTVENIKLFTFFAFILQKEAFWDLFLILEVVKRKQQQNWEICI